MNAVVEEPSKNVTELRAPGPGERLRSARVSAGVELSKVAAQLHLNDAMVHALERDDYRAMPGRVFIRGYLRNYARLVGVPAESVLKQFDDQLPDELKDRQLNRIGAGVKREVRGTHGAVRWFTWLVLFALVGALLAWWRSNFGWPGQAPEVVLEEQAEPAMSLSAPGSDGQLALPSRPIPAVTAPSPTRRDTALQTTKASPKTGAAARVTDPAAGSQPVLATSGNLLPLPPAAAGRPFATAAPPSQPTASPQAQPLGTPVVVDAPPTSLQPAASQSGIVLQFDGPCWVDVRDAKRKFKLFGEMAKGTRKVLAGNPPYDVVLGNASVVKVSIDGVPYDVTRHARGNVARFVLDPTSS